MGQLSVSRLETSVLGSSSPGGLEKGHLRFYVHNGWFHHAVKHPKAYLVVGAGQR